MLPPWIFERGGERLTLRACERGRVVILVVSGDGELRSYSFQDMGALLKFESEMEEFLLHSGWSVVAPAGVPPPIAMPLKRADRLRSANPKR